jgi:hypothetical protein
MVIPEGYRLRELVGALALVKLLFDRLISLAPMKLFIPLFGSTDRYRPAERLFLGAARQGMHMEE